LDTVTTLTQFLIYTSPFALWQPVPFRLGSSYASCDFRTSFAGMLLDDAVEILRE
jgi:hypothetical protein